MPSSSPRLSFSTPLAVRILLSVSLCMLVGSTQGTLGEKTDTLPGDAIRLSAILSQSTHSLYTEHVLTQNSGVSLYEYSRGDGIVFAVAWSGPVMPDLQQLLGNYFADFVNIHEQNGAQTGLSQFHATSSSLVIHSSGRLGAFNGLVYAPSLVPDGIDPEQLR